VQIASHGTESRSDGSGSKTEQPHSSSSIFLLWSQDSLKTLTVDEYFAKHPAVKEKIDDEIRNQNWGY